MCLKGEILMLKEMQIWEFAWTCVDTDRRTNMEQDEGMMCILKGLIFPLDISSSRSIYCTLSIIKQQHVAILEIACRKRFNSRKMRCQVALNLIEVRYTTQFDT